VADAGLDHDAGRFDQPSAARMYDYYLGGAHNFPADREAAGKVVAVYPDAPKVAQANRAFLRRAVRFMLASGVRQFLDLGSGIPTVGNVHEVVEAAEHDARVVYVDVDPVAVAHSESILGGRPDVGVVRADIRRPSDVLTAPVTTRLLDFGRPIGLLAVAVLPFVGPQDDPQALLAQFRDALVPGSYLALSHGTAEGRPDAAAGYSAVYRNTRDPLTLRPRAEITDLFTGWELVEPGLVWLSQWRPDWPDEVDADPSIAQMLCGVGHKL
jgi:SAM-dependent methyltransferase